MRVSGMTRAVLWCLVLASAVTSLHLSGRGAVGTPPLAIGAWGDWLTAVGPVVAVVALLRLAALVLGWYLVAATVLAVLARAAVRVRAGTGRWIARLPGVRWVAERGLGLAVAVSVAVGGVSGGPSSAATAVPRVAPSSSEVPEPPEQAVPGLHILLGTASVATPDERSDHDDDQPRTVLVAPGDSLWSIAEDQVTRRQGSSPSDAQIVAYWRQVIEDNRDRLVDRGDPDLILPGQRLVLPEVGGHG